MYTIFTEFVQYFFETYFSLHVASGIAYKSNPNLRVYLCKQNTLQTLAFAILERILALSNTCMISYFL